MNEYYFIWTKWRMITGKTHRNTHIFLQISNRDSENCVKINLYGENLGFNIEGRVLCFVFLSYFEWESISPKPIPKTHFKKWNQRAIDHYSYFKIYCTIEKMLLLLFEPPHERIKWQKICVAFTKITHTRAQNEINQIAIRMHNWVIAFRSVIRMGTKKKVNNVWKWFESPIFHGIWISIRFNCDERAFFFTQWNGTKEDDRKFHFVCCWWEFITECAKFGEHLTQCRSIYGYRVHCLTKSKTKKKPLNYYNVESKSVCFTKTSHRHCHQCWNKSKAIFLDQQAEQRRRTYKHRNHINIESTEHGAILILNQFKNAETHVKMWNDVSRAAHKYKNRSGIY